MPALNWYDETFTFQMTVGDTPQKVQTIPDTGLAHTVIETTTCTACATGKVDVSSGGGISKSSTAVTGSLADSTYTGFSGTATICIMKDGAYANPPTSANVPTMPCVENANVHFADSVAAPNKKATAYLGLALGEGQDRST
jgi:hypothetical protein